MNWDLYRSFLMIAEQGSVSRAAQVAGVSHATLLRAVKRLEGSLDLRLFDHARTGYRLTPDGEALLARLAPVAETLSAIARESLGSTHEPQGEAGIVLPDPDLVDLMPALQSFLARHRKVSIRVRETLPVRPGDYADPALDLVFRLSNEPPEALIGRRIKYLTLQLTAGADAPASRHFVTWGDAELAALQHEVCVRAGGAVILHARDHREARLAAAAGIGVALLADGAGPGLQVLPTPGGRRQVGLWMLTHADKRGQTRVSALMRHFAALQ